MGGASEGSDERPGALRAVAILPARIASTRLPRKMLLAETGLPLFVHSARNAERCAALSEVVVACDDDEVERTGREHGLRMVRTRPEHASGTDRVLEAFEALGGHWDVVLNVQADEPELDPEDLEVLVDAFRDAAVETATLAAPLEDPELLVTPSVVKVVTDARGDALYFSRSPLPSSSHARPGAARPETLARRHLGVYGFRPDALRAFCALGEGALERSESLEQLRWLEAGHRMRVRPARRAASGIDTRNDYEAFVARHLGRVEATTQDR